jgi:hypothetical protein
MFQEFAFGRNALFSFRRDWLCFPNRAGAAREPSRRRGSLYHRGDLGDCRFSIEIAQCERYPEIPGEWRSAFLKNLRLAIGSALLRPVDAPVAVR